MRIYQPKPNRHEFIEQYRSDFANFPRMSNRKHFWKYVKIGILTKITNKCSSEAEIQAVREELMRFLRHYVNGDKKEYQLYVDGLNRIWDNLADRMRKSPAALEYFRDYATESQSLANFMSWVPCSETMENARGYGYDIAGRYGPLDINDVAFYWSLRTPVLAGICLRIQYAQELLKTALDSGERPRVLFIGAGRLPELRTYDARREWLDRMEIVAVDEDKGVRSNIDELFRYTYAKSLQELGFVWIDQSMTEETVLEQMGSKGANHRYYNMSFAEFQKLPRYNGYFDIIITDGFMSYCRDNTREVLSDMRSLLRDDGKLVMDLQVLSLPKDLSLLQHKFALDWNTVPPLKPDFSVKSAYERIAEACGEDGLSLDDAVIYPADPGKNAVQIGVGFTLRRLPNWRKY